MAHVRKKKMKNGKLRYYAEFYDPKRRPKRKWVNLRTDDPEHAEVAKWELEKDYRYGVFDPWEDAVPEHGLTLDEAISRFLRSKASKRPKTRETYRQHLQLFQKGLPCDIDLHAVEPRHIRKHLGRPSLQDASRASYYRHLRAFFNWSIKKGLLTSSPIDKVDAPENGRKEAAYLTPRQVNKLLDTIESHTEKNGNYIRPGENTWLVDVILFAVSTGLRRGEIVNLRWSAVDLESGCETVAVRNHGDFKTKSGHERRVPLVGDALEVIRCLDAERQSREDDYVFKGVNGKQLYPNYVTKRFRDFRRLAGLPEDIHFHTLRHTCASWLVMANVPLSVVQAILGHSDISVTQRYSHVAGALHGEMNRAMPLRHRGNDRASDV